MTFYRQVILCSVLELHTRILNDYHYKATEASICFDKKIKKKDIILEIAIHVVEIYMQWAIIQCKCKFAPHLQKKKKKLM